MWDILWKSELGIDIFHWVIEVNGMIPFLESLLHSEDKPFKTGVSIDQSEKLNDFLPWLWLQV